MAPLETHDTAGVLSEPVRIVELPDVMSRSDQGGLGQDAGVLEIALGDAPGRGAVRGDQVPLHVRRKGVSPEVGLELSGTW